MKAPHSHTSMLIGTAIPTIERIWVTEAEASIAANQVRYLPPVDVAVDRVTGGVEVG